MSTKIPGDIITAVNAILAPYGEIFTPRDDVGSSVAQRGYLGTAAACKFLSISRTYLFYLVKQGRLHTIKMKDSRNCKTVYSVAELEAYAESRKNHPKSEENIA